MCVRESESKGDGVRESNKINEALFYFLFCFFYLQNRTMYAKLLKCLMKFVPRTFWKLVRVPINGVYRIEMRFFPVIDQN